MKKVLCYIRIYVLAFKSMFKLNIGDTVIYKGKEFYLIQGIAKPSWNLVDKHDTTAPTEMYVHESNFKKCVSWENIKHDLQVTYNFYHSYWFSIWVQEPALEIIRMTIPTWLNRGNKKRV
jgi:hypothetical protein